jgi:hypothetical protein
VIASEPVLRVCAVLVVLSLFVSAGAHAQEPTICGAPPSDTEVRARLAFLSGAVRREEPAIRRWWTTFAFLHAAMASATGILAASSQNEDFRNEMLVGVTSSTLALTTILIFNPPLLGAGDQLRALPDDTPEARLLKMRAAESVFLRSSANIDFFWGWFPATLSSLYVTAAASTLLLAFNRPTGALTHSIGGAVLGLGRLLLHPTGARSIWRRYRRAYADAGCVDTPVTASIQPRVAIVPHALGLGVRIDF